MPKCDFNKVALQLYRNQTSAWVFFCKFAAYFRNTLCKEHLQRAAFVLRPLEIGDAVDFDSFADFFFTKKDFLLK